MANLNITDLDFDSIKNNFKDYLKSQDKFKDYNFEGSSISIFLDILAYNTFYNSFYTNVIANEMFLDSASDRAAVVSRAKALGYTPDSTISSSAYIDIESHVLKQVGEIPPTSNSTISIQQYAEFITSVKNSDFSFLSPSVIPLEYSLDGGSYWVYKKSNVKIVEGKRLSYSWKVQNAFDRYVIPNAGVDVNTLVVRVRESESSLANTIFYKAGTIIDITSSSAVYWVSETADQKFYIEFGNDILGKKVDIDNIIDIEYFVSSGQAANGAQTFTVGNYQYANSLITDISTLSITNSNYSVLGVTDVNSTFTANTKIRGLTSNATGYVLSFDSINSVLKLFSTTGSFAFNESIAEEAIINSNLVYGANASITTISTETSISSNGSDIESINSIKFYAPKTFSSQNRLVTTDDYEGVLRNEYQFIDAISAWGGEEETPQQLGHIFVATKPSGAEVLQQWEKDYILDNIIEPRKMIGMNVHIVDADYVYIYPSINIKYNTDLISSVTQESIIDDVKNSVTIFNADLSSKFKNSFYFTPFCTAIDASSPFILGNDTTILMMKLFKPALGFTYSDINSVALNYGNYIYPFTAISASVRPIITSSSFTCNVANTLYTDCSFIVSPYNLMAIAVANSTSTVVSEAGDIDYENGIITVNNVNITATELKDSNNTSIVQIFAAPMNIDLSCSKEQILSIYPHYPVSGTPIKTQ